MIEKRLALLAKSEQEYKTHREMLADSLANDSALASEEEKLKEAKHRYNATKEALLNEPENRKIVEKMKDVAIEIKDSKKLLADELFAYVLKHNTTEYVDSKGGKRRIAVSAKLAKGEDGED